MSDSRRSSRPIPAGHHVRFPPAQARGLGLNQGMTLDFDTCYRAVLARDPRFDGRFFTAVTSTGIYCRPVCPARTPARANMRFFRHPGAAEAAGFRACRRCRPETSPGSPEWNARADLAARAVRLISAGYVDEHGIGGLAARLAVTERHLHRLLVAELGTGPLALARTVRLQTARRLLAETSLPITDIAFASGFSSVRQFNATVLESSGRTPSQLRAAARGAGRRESQAADGPGTWLTLRLACREPYDAAALLDFLAVRAVPGVEQVTARRLLPDRAHRGRCRADRAAAPAGPGACAAPGPAGQARRRRPAGVPLPAAAGRGRRPGRDRHGAGRRRPDRAAGPGPAGPPGAGLLRRLRTGRPGGPGPAGVGGRGAHVRRPAGRPARHPAARGHGPDGAPRTRPGTPRTARLPGRPDRTCCSPARRNWPGRT